MTEKLIIAGFGGQGVILAGKLLAYGGMIDGFNVSHIPSYGVEMRGGTANCAVIISDKDVASPLVSHPTSLIVMNKPSLDKFESAVVQDGNIFVNESLIERKVERDDVKVFYVPANKLAEEAGNGRASNMVMIGAFIAGTGVVTKENVKNSLTEVISRRNIKYNEVNYRAFDMGFDYVKNH
ncbi:MAG TPA: 2-oxoacid:ferredoxin oxidoreductase subunit gamma [Spirochaetes bacterium]|nr:2-oxoacid:ferredoxin oxidoreductase subunit gamma [Spirochaetota bacterium]